MSDIQTTGTVTPFQYERTELRSILRGEDPWFISSDALALLDLNRSSLTALDGDEKGVHTLDTLGGAQRVGIISESGLYSLILRSRKPEARAIKKWITSEVLPTIRKTGSYGTAPALTEDEIVAQALAITTRKVEALTAKVEELEPKADLADTYLTSQGGARLVREVAKTFGWKEKDLRRWLLDERLIFVKHAPCGNVQYDFFAEFAHHFQVRETVVNHTWGSCSHYTLMVLPRGVELIHKRMTRPAGGAA